MRVAADELGLFFGRPERIISLFWSKQEQIVYGYFEFIGFVID